MWVRLSETFVKQQVFGYDTGRAATRAAQSLLGGNAARRTHLQTQWVFLGSNCIARWDMQYYTHVRK